MYTNVWLLNPFKGRAQVSHVEQAQRDFSEHKLTIIGQARRLSRSRPRMHANSNSTTNKDSSSNSPSTPTTTLQLFSCLCFEFTRKDFESCPEKDFHNALIIRKPDFFQCATSGRTNL